MLRDGLVSVASDSTARLRLRNADTGFHETDSRTKCRFCHDAYSKYTCPRCNLPYCSVDCFKSSNHAGCSESFYKDCLMQEMQSQTFTSSEKLKVMKMIQDHERNCMDDEENEVESLQTRLEGVNLDDGDSLWTMLTADEKADFQRSLAAGSLIEEWTPWWYYHDTSLVTEIDKSADKALTDSIPATVPNARLDIPKLTELLGGKVPSPLIANNLTEVLYVYAYYTRKYNGSTKDFTVEFGCNLILSSTFLLDDLTRPSLIESVQLTMERCLSQNKDTSASVEIIEILVDVYHILVGPRKDDIALYAKASIADSHAHCKALKHCCNKNSRINRRTVRKALKKLEFLYAWVDQYSLQLPIVATEVLNIFKSKMDWHKIHENEKQAVDKMKRCVVAQNQLIKEIT